MENSLTTYRRENSLSRLLFAGLILLPIVYNFHRYLFRYGHAEFIRPDTGYQPIPLFWKLGKYIIMLALLAGIYLNARFRLVLNRRQLLAYGLVFLFLAVNLTTVLLQGVVATDEIEYQLYALLLLPMCFIPREDLLPVADRMYTLFDMAEWLIVGSNLLVIFNYLVFHRLPFHAYEGIIIRFGGLWDDPNGFSIFSVFLFGYSLFRKQRVFTFFHVVNVLLAFSVTSYILLIVVTLYWFLNHPNRYINLLFIALGGLVLLLIAVAEWDVVMRFYALKRESVGLHATFGGDWPTLPGLSPMLFSETWLLSMTYNYFPFSLILLGLLFWAAFDTFFNKPKSIQRLFFLVFFFASLFLPFMYFFPINFFFLFVGSFYLKGIYF